MKSKLHFLIGFKLLSDNMERLAEEFTDDPETTLPAASPLESAKSYREKKAKPEKAEICSAMMNGLKALGVDEFNITNEEREFLFHHNGVKYKVTLACPRS